MRPEETVDYHIKSSWHSISRMYNQLASSYNLTQAAAFMLLSIDPEHGTNATQIGPLMGMEATGMSRLLNNLEKEGLIHREKDDDDGRKVKICLTGEGVEKRKMARRVVKRFNQRILDEIGEEDFAVFKDIMQKVQHVVEEYKNYPLKNYHEKDQ